MYMVYGKRKGGKRFYPFDMNSNRFVRLRIHATVFLESQLTDLKREVDSLNELNPEYVFEIRSTI